MKIIVLRWLIFIFVQVPCFSKRPHIVVITGDQIGWNDFSFHGSSQIPTPNIDALGYNGVFLNKIYTQPTSSASRAAFLTGKYPIRYGYQGTPVGTGEDRPLPHDTELLPEKLKKLGYKTHLVGKWHLSAARKNDTPTARGFDTHFGFWNGFIGYFSHLTYKKVDLGGNTSTIWPGLDLHDGFKPQWQYQGRYITDLLTEKSLEIIEKHNVSESLFLYMGHLAGHTGAYATELEVPNITITEEKYSYIEEPMRRRFADIVNLLDKSVGQVVKKLKEKKILENSIILFMSDNGALTKGMYPNYGSNYPFKGLKYTLFEGGVRGSAVLFSPLLHKKRYVNNNLMHLTDLYATFLQAAGGRRETNNYDGISQWDSISSNLSSHRDEILLNIDEVLGFSGLISYFGRYKYLNGSYLNGINDGAQGDNGRQVKTPAYNINGVLQSNANQAIKALKGISSLTPQKIKELRVELDMSSCNGKARTSDPPCLGECLFDLWTDPCETENIIDKSPEIRNYMRKRLNVYLQHMEPSRKKNFDFNSNPHNCNDTWFPWLDVNGCPKAF